MKSLRRATAADHDAVVALQTAAYAENQIVLGAVPLPLQADYTQILRDRDVWLIWASKGLDGALVLEVRPDDLLIWSLATHPRARSLGIGRTLLEHAELRAREEQRETIRLYTAEVFISNIAWYRRNGFSIESREQLSDRTLINMVKKTIS